MKLVLNFEKGQESFKSTVYGERESLRKIVEIVQQSNCLICYCAMVDTDKEKAVVEHSTEEKVEENDLPFTA